MGLSIVTKKWFVYIKKKKDTAAFWFYDPSARGKTIHDICILDILFLSNHNIHKSSCGLCFLGFRPFKKIYRPKCLEPKNKGHTNFFESCDLTKKIYLKFSYVVVYISSKSNFFSKSIFLEWKKTQDITNSLYDSNQSHFLSRRSLCKLSCSKAPFSII